MEINQKIIVAVILLGLFGAAPAYTKDEDANLVRNSGFEDDAAGSITPEGYALWKTDSKGTSGIDDGVGYKSLKSVKVAGVSVASYLYSIDVLPGEKYLVESFCTKKGQGTPSMSVYWKDANKEWNWSAGTSKQTYKPFDGKWRRAVARVQVPAEGVSQLTVLFGVENQGSEKDIVWFDSISIRKLPAETEKAAAGKADGLQRKIHIIPFAAPPITPDDYTRNQSQEETVDTLRMRPFTYSNISQEEAEFKMKEAHDAGYNIILTEGQRYLLVDSPDHPRLGDIREGSLPYPDNVRNTKHVVDAAHKYGLKVYLHLTANSVADYFASAHPDWMSVSLKDGTPMKTWGSSWACLNNKEFAKLFYQRLDNLIRESGADGLMVDETVTMYDSCGCSSCRQLFKDETGLELPEIGAPWLGDLSSPLYKTFLDWRANNGIRENKKIRDILLSSKPDGIMLSYYAFPYYEKAMAEHGAMLDRYDWLDALGWECGDWYKTNYEKKWTFFIANLKLVRAISEHGTGNIYTIDGHVSYTSLYFHWLLRLSQGAHAYAYEHPSAWNPPLQWETKYQNYYAGLKSSADVAVYISSRNNNLISSPSGRINRQNSYFAICNTLTLAHIPYKVIVDKDIQSSISGDKTKTIIMMNIGLLSDTEAEVIRKFVKDGGTLIASAETSLYNEKGERRPDFALADIFGCKYIRLVQGGGMLAIKGKDPVLGNFSGEIIHPDDFIAVEASGSSKVLGYLQDEDSTDVPGLILNNYGKGKVIYFAGHPETSLYLAEYNNTAVLPRTIDDPPDPKMAQLFCNIVKSSSPGSVSVDNLPAGVVVETYAHNYKGAQGIQVHLLNMAGVVSGLLSPEKSPITFPDIKPLLPDQGKPIQITVRGENIRNAFMYSPDFDGLYELPIEKRDNAVICKIPSFARYQVIYFNQGETSALHALAGIPVCTGEPVIKIIETTELPPEKKVIPKTNEKGETVSASSQYDSNCNPSKAWDGEYYKPDVKSSLWSCEDGEDVNSWWMVDLGSRKSLDKVKVQYRENVGIYIFVPVSVTVQVSDDGANWTNTTSRSANVPKAGSPYDGKLFEYTVGTDARYLRLLFQDGGTPCAGAKGIQLVEVEVSPKGK